jgi:hypothetical protein
VVRLNLEALVGAEQTGHRMTLVRGQETHCTGSLIILRRGMGGGLFLFPLSFLKASA